MMDRAQLSQRIHKGEKFEFVFFWGHSVPKDGKVGKTCFSQWYPAPFTIDDITYPTAEHWMMACKARLFNDPDALKEILECTEPQTAKAIGRRVQNFDEAIWKANARRLVTEGNIEKFHQNQPLSDVLLATGDSVIVEASPRDCIWGIGLGQDNPRAQHPDTWRDRTSSGLR